MDPEELLMALAAARKMTTSDEEYAAASLDLIKGAAARAGEPGNKTLSAYDVTAGGALVPPPAFPRRRLPAPMWPGGVELSLLRVGESPLNRTKSLAGGRRFVTYGAKSPPPYYTKEMREDKRGHTYCVEPGEGRVPCGGEGGPRESSGTSSGARSTAPPKKTPKPKASRGVMVSARREGTGKDAKVVMGDGSPAPAHITPAMVGADWTDVKVAANPNSDVLVTGRDKNGRAKTVYSDNFHMKQAALKFARTRDGLIQREAMLGQVRGKGDDNGDCCWLMMEQGTRPGSESDNKGVSELFGVPVDASSFAADGDKLTMKVGGQAVPIKDKKARAEIRRRIEAGEPLYDSTYWLKSHGATTLEGRHIVVTPDGVYLRFMGKESVWHDHRVRDPELAKMLIARKEKAGDRGKLFNTNYDKVGKYAATLDGGKFTPKDFRTQRATSLAIEEINKMEPPKDEKAYKEQVKAVAAVVSGVLGNEPAQALESYIDPNVFSVWKVQ